MSPTTSTRPVWVWSLPAVAIIISFLWYRKKRGALQTDTGGPGEPVKISDPYPKSERESPDQVDSVSAVPDSNPPAIDKVLDRIDDNTSDAPVVDEVEILVLKAAVAEVEAPSQKACVVEEVAVAQEVSSVQATIAEVCVKAEADSTAEPLVEIAEELQSKEITPEERVALEVPVEVQADLIVQDNLSEDNTAICQGTSSLIEILPKTEVAKEEDVLCSPDAKWSNKKRKSKKGKNTMKTTKSVDLEQQLAKLELNGQEAVEGAAEAEEKTGGERDSANTSPSEVMLASPSLSGFSDTHSEGSSDSGKGCSDVLTPSPTPVSGNSLSGDLPCDLPAICVFEFAIPQHLVGRLIGRSGSYIHEIKDSTHASVYIKRHPGTTKMKICAIEGTQLDIDNALGMIRQKFPKKRYPNVTLEPVEHAPSLPPILPEYMQLYLPDAVNNDVVICSLITAGHFFVQQPIHPTFPALNQLQVCMNASYSAEPNLPGLPDDFPLGVLCAAPLHSGWYRACVMEVDGPTCVVKFVDFGGFMTIEKAHLRQIRTDFATLPFQASECFLAGIEPIDDEWSEEARLLVESLTLNKMLQAQIHGYTDNMTPLVFLFTVHENQVVSVNAELVSQGYAQYLLPEPVTEESDDYLQQPEQVLLSVPV